MWPIWSSFGIRFIRYQAGVSAPCHRSFALERECAVRLLETVGTSELIQQQLSSWLSQYVLSAEIFYSQNNEKEDITTCAVCQSGGLELMLHHTTLPSGLSIWRGFTWKITRSSRKLTAKKTWSRGHPLKRSTRSRRKIRDVHRASLYLCHVILF